MKTLRAFGMVATVAILLGRAEILLAANTEQSPGTGPKLVSESSESLMTVGDKCFRLWVTDDTVAGTPSWDSELEPPPLDLVKAIKLSRDVLPEIMNESPDLILHSVELNRNSLADRWYYVISWLPRRAGYRGDSLAIAILMNGRVIRPEKRSCNGEEKTQVVH